MVICRRWVTACVAVAAVALGACSPPLNWRTVRPDGANVELLFPCSPDRRVRTLRMGGAEVPMEMLSCAAAGVTFSIAFVDAPDAARVTPMVVELRGAAVANIAGTSSGLPLAVPPGATPNGESGALRIVGHLADGRAVVEQAAFFVKGVRVYQASALGERLSAEAADIFFTSIKVAP